ncbi:MAG: preprotein translocase subunit YajC [Longimicrobiales bacterium]
MLMSATIALQQPTGQSMLPMIVMWTAIILIFWLLVFRPQRQAQKRHQEMLAALKRGDDVMTDGGIIGQIVHMADDRVTLRTAESTRILVARSKIQRTLAPVESKET